MPSIPPVVRVLSHAALPVAHLREQVDNKLLEELRVAIHDRLQQIIPELTVQEVEVLLHFLLGRADLRTFRNGLGGVGVRAHPPEGEASSAKSCAVGFSLSFARPLYVMR